MVTDLDSSCPGSWTGQLSITEKNSPCFLGEDVRILPISLGMESLLLSQHHMEQHLSTGAVCPSPQALGESPRSVRFKVPEAEQREGGCFWADRQGVVVCVCCFFVYECSLVVFCCL